MKLQLTEVLWDRPRGTVHKNRLRHDGKRIRTRSVKQARADRPRYNHELGVVWTPERSTLDAKE